MTEERVFVRENVEPVKNDGFKPPRILSKLGSAISLSPSPTPSSTPTPADDQDLPERIEHPSGSAPANNSRVASSTPPVPLEQTNDIDAKIPAKAGFDFEAIGKVLREGNDFDPERIPNTIVSPKTQTAGIINSAASLERSESAPPPLTQDPSPVNTPKAKSRQLEEMDEASQTGSLPSITTLRKNPPSLSFQVDSRRDDLESQEVFTSPTSLTTQGSLSLAKGTAPSWPPPSSRLSFAPPDISIRTPNRRKPPTLTQYEPYSTDDASSPPASSAESEPSIAFDHQAGMVESSPRL